jgi:Ca2+:H+ antiporter
VPFSGGGLNSSNMGCQSCYWENGAIAILENDPVYQERTRPLVWFCAVLLPIAYIVGLIFTLRTHAHIYDKHQEEQAADADAEEAHGHSQHGPIWSKLKSISILLVSTVLLALVAELVVNNVEPLIEAWGVSEAAVGLVLVALLPDVAEIVNGVQFALQNNIALSIEIGSSIAVQVCLLQVPLLVCISELFLAQDNDATRHFTLIFPDMYVFVVFFSAICMNYIFQDGKSDYFQGSVLLVIYGIMVAILLF